MFCKKNCIIVYWTFRTVSTSIFCEQRTKLNLKACTCVEWLVGGELTMLLTSRRTGNIVYLLAIAPFLLHMLLFSLPAVHTSVTHLHFFFQPTEFTPVFSSQSLMFLAYSILVSKKTLKNTWIFKLLFRYKKMHIILNICCL